MSENTITIAIGADHAGYAYKELLKDFLSEYTVKDFGTHSLDSVDYPDFAHPLAAAVENGTCTFGILLCGSANGVAITANKHAGIRAGLCWENEVASLVRKHNNANVLCIPARFVSEEQAKEIVTTFLNTEFEGGRHQSRVDKISC
ncbi:ribose 5-phosphate isomerase B [Pedobacter sandarakinus]|uniref:ribose 5-phosphate isomerase B n=1 Tax=Pedobacter sandarakinus TaxID=353156 RepID=UPI002246393B|nr:ribose 5-phosphate isomerase B [Pedobacter sandarakinus]MCX2573364.1 ribose 5-phosphate isomerase B [Pedobacter sandarakinus]